jgi:hypothetical protein
MSAKNEDSKMSPSRWFLLLCSLSLPLAVYTLIAVPLSDIPEKHILHDLWFGCFFWVLGGTPGVLLCLGLDEFRCFRLPVIWLVEGRREKQVPWTVRK